MRLVRPIAFALAVLAAIALVACAHRPTESATSAAVADADADAVPNLRTPGNGLLLTAAQPGPGAWRVLAEQGVVAVVNLRPDDEQPGRDERAEVTAAGMAYHQVPVAGADGLTDDNAAKLWALVSAVPGKVLVHCASGNRAGALLALGAASAGAMSPEQALAFGQSAGLTQPKLEAAVRAKLGLPESGE